MAKKLSIRSTPIYTRVVALLARAYARAVWVSGAIVVVAVGVLLVKQVIPSGVEVLPWHVGPTLQEKGFDAQTLTAEFEADLRQIRAVAATSLVDPTVDIADDERPPEFVVPATGTSTGVIVENLRYLFGVQARRIRGNATLVGDRLLLRVGDTGSTDLTFEVTLGGQPIDEQVSKGLRDLASRVVSTVSPYAAGVYLYNVGQFGAAERAALMLLGGGSKAEQLRALNLLGLIAQKRGAPVEARLRFMQVLALDPSFALAENNLGLLDEATGHAPQAADHYRKARAMDPKLSLSVVNLGRLLLHDQPKDALALLQQGVAMGGAEAGAHVNLAQALQGQGRDDEAEAQYAAAAAAAPESAALHLAWGLHYLTRWDRVCAEHHDGPDCASLLTSSEAHVTTATVLDPASAMAHTVLGDVLTRQADSTADEAARRRLLDRAQQQLRLATPGNQTERARQRLSRVDDPPAGAALR